MAHGIGVFICDDHRLFRQGLISLFSSAENGVTIVGESGDGDSAIAQLEDLEVEVLLLDVMMPGRSGLEIAETLAETHPDVAIILLTTHKDPTAVARALKMGVGGYLLKDDAFDEIAFAIRKVAAGETYVSGSLAGALLSQTVRETPTTALSPREKEVVTLVAKGYQNKEIADLLGVGVTTIRTHRARLMEKLDLHNSADIVRHALENGLA
ncbi:MAG: response regulator transcription factor [Verrucomicrobiota bacterium]